MALPDPIPAEIAGADEDAKAVALAVSDALAMAAQQGIEPGDAGRTIAEWQSPWMIADDGGAEWAMRLLAAAEAKLAEAEERAIQWRKQVDDWYRKVTAEASATSQFARAHLERYALERRYADPDAKTLYLPSGVVRTTSHADRITINDEPAVLAWALERAPEVVRHTVKVSDVRHVVSVVEGKAVDPDTGEVVAGLSVERGRTSASVVVQG